MNDKDSLNSFYCILHKMATELAKIRLSYGCVEAISYTIDDIGTSLVEQARKIDALREAFDELDNFSSRKGFSAAYYDALIFKVAANIHWTEHVNEAYHKKN